MFTVRPGGDEVYYFLFISRYDNTTGVFTVPPGGDGVYFFSSYVTAQSDKYGYFDMEHYDTLICSMEPDASGSGRDQASCSGIVRLVAGDEILVAYIDGTDNTPLHTYDVPFVVPPPNNGFSGFKI